MNHPLIAVSRNPYSEILAVLDRLPSGDSLDLCVRTDTEPGRLELTVELQRVETDFRSAMTQVATCVLRQAVRAGLPGKPLDVFVTDNEYYSTRVFRSSGVSLEQPGHPGSPGRQANRAEVAGLIRELLAGRVSRAELSKRAAQFDSSRSIDPDLHEALDGLILAELAPPNQAEAVNYLYADADLARLAAALT